MLVLKINLHVLVIAHCGLKLLIDYCLMKLYLELFIFLLRIVCSDISMFDDIEDVLINVDSQVCLLGDFNAHTSNVNEYSVY